MDSAAEAGLNLEMQMTEYENKNIRELLGLASEDPVFVSLREEIRDSKRKYRANIFGVEAVQLAYAAAALGTSAGRPVCLIVADELRLRAMRESVAAFLPSGEKVEALSARDLNLAPVEAASHEEEIRRQASLNAWLHGEVQCLLVSASALAQKFRPVEVAQQSIREFKAGDVCEPADLEKILVGYGYEKVTRAENAGEFARRGDIIDIVPHDVSSDVAVQAGEIAAGVRTAWRLSFFDDEIDEMKCYDPDSQRSVANLERLVLMPLLEIAPMDYRPDDLALRISEYGKEALIKLRRNAAASAQVEKLGEHAERDSELLNRGIHLQSPERWLDFIFPDAASILDYVEAQNAIVLIEEPALCRRALDASQADFYKRFEAYLLEGQTFPAAEACQWTGAEAFTRLDQSPCLLAAAQLKSAANGLPQAREIRIEGREAERFHGGDERLEAFLRMEAAAGRHIWLMAQSEERVKALRERAAAGAWPCKILKRSLRSGFRYPAASLIVLGSEDVFGVQRRGRQRRKDKNTLRLNFFSDLQIGDKVVHESNGIGIYKGISNTRDASGQRRDYLTIAYAAGDTLYLPMDQLAQLQKYVGTDADQVKLSRLGSGEWQRQKERARSTIRQLVTDLIKLYSQRATIKGHAFQPETIWDREFAARFPYEETDDQLRCIREITEDMESDKVMDRLLCGDVGFGKTEVAFRAMFKCVQDGYQAALLAPTTVLVQQHYENFLKRVADFPVRVGMLSRFASPALRKKTVRGLESGMIDVVIGTHRMLSGDVQFKKLGLLVIDEEQRFGVDHKEGIKARHPEVDVLSMSATPIPRTLHMSMSGIRDISVLEEAPEERRPVRTFVMEYDAFVIREAILRELGRGGQVFYLHNDTRSIDRKAAELEASLPGARVAFAHGKMSEQELETVIEEFLAGQTDILVCTTIIESGIDMPRVNTIVVEDADRMGLSQLYQLRGRVGRSERQAYAYVTYRPDKVLNEMAVKRLAAIRSFTELGAGFTIALRDLEIRGAGNLLGGEQHGQLNAIGYDLYTRMLAEEIEAAQAREKAIENGERPASQAAVRVECSFEIALDAYIPASFIPDDGERMEMYRRISHIETEDLYRDVMDEILDRYGEPCRELQVLMDVAYIRAQASRMGVSRIGRGKGAVILQFAGGGEMNMERLSRLMSLAEYNGQLLFNAGVKPYIVARGLGEDAICLTEKLRKLFMKAEKA